jgi:hypothetical protein
MGRRAFVGALAGGLLAAPLAGAQSPKGPRRIAALLDFSPPPPGSPSLTLEALRDLGYQDGQNVSVDLRWTDGQRDRSSALADELVRQSPDVIVTGANESTAAVMRATKTIPIVMALAVNPVESRFISSLARPGGNVTGVTVDVGPEIWAKRLEVLKQVAPTVSRVSVLWSPVWGRAAGVLGRGAAGRSQIRDDPPLRRSSYPSRRRHRALREWTGSRSDRPGRPDHPGPGAAFRRCGPRQGSDRGVRSA